MQRRLFICKIASAMFSDCVLVGAAGEGVGLARGIRVRVGDELGRGSGGEDGATKTM